VTEDSLSFEVLRPNPVGLPHLVEAAIQEAGRCVVVSATRAGRVVAHLVAAPVQRWVEVFELSDPAAVWWCGPPVPVAKRFSFLAQRVMQDRTRFFTTDDDGPSGGGLITETLLYREPDQIVHQVETTIRGVVLEHVFEAVDISQQYASKPSAGDWAYFLDFGQR
jgi:hypothetical protein